MKKIICLILSAFIMITGFLFFSVSAAEGQEIEILYTDADEKITDASFSLYYLGSYEGTTVIPNETFSAYSVSFDVSDSEKLLSLANTLSAYALRDKITPLLTDKTDAKGIADFDGTELKKGAYMIIGQKHFQNNKYYFSEPVIMLLPYGNSQVITLKPKFETVDERTQTISVSYKVLKAWTGDEKEKRPIEIQVELLRDGEIYDTVTLNYSNNWKYQWDNLSAYYHWTVTEKYVAGGYEVSLSQLEKAFLLTNQGNRHEETTSPEDTTTSNNTTKPDSSSSPDESPTGTKPSDGDKTTAKTTTTSTTKPDKDSEKEDELPETGMLMWPVPYLALLGLLLFIVGYVIRRKGEAENG